MSAFCALVNRFVDKLIRIRFAFRTDKSIFPPQSEQVIAALLLSIEASYKFVECHRIFSHAPIVYYFITLVKWITRLYEITLDKDHGRIETRECYIWNDAGWLSNVTKWPSIHGIGAILSKRQETGKEPTFSREYVIFSLKDAKASDILRLKRSHWAIENNLHWSLDVTFREDEARARLGNAAENLNILRKQAL